MDLKKARDLFEPRPCSSLIMALLWIVLGAVSISGLVPTSPNRLYFPGHECILAGICLIAAVFFIQCAYAGFKSKKWLAMDQEE